MKVGWVLIGSGLGSRALQSGRGSAHFEGSKSQVLLGLMGFDDFNGKVQGYIFPDERFLLSD